MKRPLPPIPTAGADLRRIDEGRAHRAILVGTALDEPAAFALRRAHELARIFDARLHVVHVVPRGSDAGDAKRQAVRRWAEREAGLVLSPRGVLVEEGDPAATLLRSAEETSADLVVVGRPLGDGSTVAGLCRSLSRSLLIADRERNREEVVAATDMLHPQFPIVHSAARLARAIAAQVTVVHNLEGTGPSAGVRLDTVLDRVHSLERLSRELASVRAASVGTTRSTADAIDAIADLAHARDADIVVVGARAGRGRTLASLLDKLEGRSVLAVPLPPVEVAA